MAAGFANLRADFVLRWPDQIFLVLMWPMLLRVKLRSVELGTVAYVVFCPVAGGEALGSGFLPSWSTA